MNKTNEVVFGFFSVTKIDGVYAIKGKFGLLTPKFLAKNPNDEELFLLLEKQESCFLFKGDEKNGLQFCKPIVIQLFNSCMICGFKQQDETSGFITNPYDINLQAPSYNGIPLEIVPYKIVEIDAF